MPIRLLPPVGVEQYVHLMSRTCSKTRFFNDDRNKRKFIDIMRRTQEFSGCRVMAYSIMPNHFHVLLHTPKPEQVPDKELFRRIRVLYGGKYYHELLHEIKSKRMESSEAVFQLWWKVTRNKYINRMYSTPAYMKTLKQRYACWHNREYNRDGVFWGQRYKSVLIEDKPGALFAMSTYIENNAARLGIVDEAQHYEFCSLGAAVRGDRRARSAIIDLVNMVSGDFSGAKANTLSRSDFHKHWENAFKNYMGYVVVSGHEIKDDDGNIIKHGYSPEKVKEILQDRGRVTFVQTLHSRVRYMTYGIVYGSKEFCHDLMEMFPEKFSKKLRRNGVRMKKVGFDDIYTGRNLQKYAVTAPNDPPIREG